jgi:2-polyprenyl-6-methoxyphenol hydroxylase-like FAD-dependent oxidoreductase
LPATGREEQIQTLPRVFGDVGWIVPNLVEATAQSPQLYFDTISQIELTPWSQGRVALVGDACQLLSLLAGQGASMAMAGAYILANELRETNGQPRPAFEAYERKLKPEIDRRQQQARGLARWFVPESRFDIWMMFLFLRLAFLPVFRTAFRRQVGA